MKSSTSFIEGILIGEQKNRFLCTVKIGDVIEECYVPSSCRLSNLISIKNPKVILREVTTKNSRTNYAVYAIKKGRTYILVDLSDANRILYSQIHRRIFSFLGPRKNVITEETFGDYRSDLFVKDTSTIIEVKTVISDLSSALFPTIHSDRALKQLKALSNLLDAGYNAYLFIFALSPTIKEIIINSEDKLFAELLKSCCQKGLIIQGFNIRIINQKPTINNKIPIITKKP